jgi:hypothetical protein
VAKRRDSFGGGCDILAQSGCSRTPTMGVALSLGDLADGTGLALASDWRCVARRPTAGMCRTSGRT